MSLVLVYRHDFTMRGSEPLKCSNDEFEAYLRETLHVPAHLEPWRKEPTLPGYLRGQYRFFEGTVADVHILFLRSNEEPTPRVAKKHEQVLRQQWDGPIAFAFDRITPYNRQRMIREGLSFVVPRSQLYLPTLGMDLRERYKTRGRSGDRLRPSAQVLFLHALAGDSSTANTPSGFARRLGYTPMAMGQALDQLEEVDLVRIRKAGRERLFDLAADPAGLWLKAQPLLASPVKRRRYMASESDTSIDGMPSGLSALAAYSSLTEPRISALALAAQQAKNLPEILDGRETLSADEADIEIEVWSYPPRLLCDGPAVDRLSLYLSLRDDADERVQSALDEMMRGVIWCEV
jgi:hypothetical protein